MTSDGMPDRIGTSNVTGYKCSDRGLLLPLVDESSWSVTTRAVLYFIAMIYSFFGISIAADVFMCAIEKITSQTRTVKIKHPEFGSMEDLEGSVVNRPTSARASSVREVKVWNPTVANLTLMALGSSAPEILLTLIEVVGHNFKAGILGPSTVVGSAAFNLLIITAVCISSVAASETRRISEILVFIVTSSFCIFAYIWLLLIIKVISPNVVEVWEALITLLLFVVFVVTAYVADRKFCLRWISKKKVHIVMPGELAMNGDSKTRLKNFNENPETHKEEVELETMDPNGNESSSRPVTAKSIKIPKSATTITNRDSARPMTTSGWMQIERQLAKKFPQASAEQLARLTAHKIDTSREHSRLYYRIAASKWLAASGRTPQDSLRPESATPLSSQNRPVTAISNATMMNQLAVEPSKLSIIEFAANKYAVSESDNHVRLKVVRENRTNKRVLFKYETLDGTAKRGKDYISQAETLVFNPSETEKIISIQILKDREKEPDEMFYVKLALEDFADGRTLIGPNNVAMVTIMDNDKDTKIQFPQTAMAVRENIGTVHVPVTRRGNTKMQACVEWNTVDASAHNGTDFIGGTGVIEFDSGEIEKHIDIPIIDDKEFEKHESFEVILSNPTEGASLSSKKKKCIITILNDDETALLLTQSDKLIPKQLETLQPGAQSWREQFIHAANVNGGDIEGATAMDYIVHVMTFGWKLIFAFVPPPVIWGGWLTFIISLTLIGVLTTIVGDLSTIFGCLVGLKDLVTAITFVSLGTSLPDLFASRLAATHEKTADNSVGNITGSNSVNVFLGLGIAWFTAAIYWWRQGGEFVVPAGNLSFSVTVYTITAALCIGLLVLRRKVLIFGRAELGGPRLTKWLCSGILVLFWVIYVAFSTLQAYEYLPGF